ncbi:IS1595 family transposase [Vitreimonas flagellata]|uniref:IS1595 family transposase n=1 Tax=Vitreimonas flagellata TaxID=2560861 RepID=UPI001074CBE3|nr:IS1595 family transposase [Vitreimonas flagellata]
MSKSVLAAAHFHDEAAAFAYLEEKLWPQGPVCPKCGGEGYALNGVKDKKGRERLGLKKCRACRSQFTLRIGTIFEDSHAPLHLWLQAIALMAASKKGISSNQLSRVLGVQLKTAWHMSHRIRLAMAPAGRMPPMGGAGRVVEIDETYHGKVANPAALRKDGKEFSKRGGKKRSGPANKRAIVALIERGGSARTFHVAEANTATVAKIVRENVDPESRVHTDASSLYKFVGREFAEHATVEHSMGEYVRFEENGAVHNNSCESYFSVFKRGMKGVYQHCSEKHLHRYLAEFDYRHNTRVALGMDDKARAEKLITQVVGKRLTYQTTDRPA